MRNFLALDLGTATGYCYNSGNDIVLGTWHLATAKEIKEWHLDRLDRRKDPRPYRLLDRIQLLRREVPIAITTFEDVEFSTYTLQTQLWASLRTAVWIAYADPHGILDCVGVSTLKKFATGHGGATKGMMRSSLLRQPEFVQAIKHFVPDDNAVDAAHLWRWTRDHLGRTPTPTHELD